MFAKRWGLFQIVVLLTVFSAVLMVAAFDSGAAGSKELVVGIANHAAGNEFINNMVARMKQRLEELGASYNYAVADGSLAAHNTNIENLIAKGLKVIVIIGGDADGLKPNSWSTSWMAKAKSSYSESRFMPPLRSGGGMEPSRYSINMRA